MTILPIDARAFRAATKSTYLNAASVALMPEHAQLAMTEWERDLAEYGTIHFDEKAEADIFSSLRASFAGLIGARAEDVAVASSATELIASLAWAIAPGAGKNVVTTDIVFPSTAYPWARVARHTGASLRFVEARNGVVNDDELVEAIDERTAAVSICHVEYSNGQRYDLARLGAAARRVGAFLLVDGSQSVGTIPIDLARTPIDALVTTSYKWLCGPFGVGLLSLAPEWSARLDPGLVGWRSHREIYDLRADRCIPFDDARRFEFSTMAYGCAIGLGRSIDLVSGTGVDQIFRQNVALGNRLADGLRALGVEIVSPLEAERRSPITSARFPGHSPEEVVRRLGAAGVVASRRRDLVRFSPHLYNTEADIDRALTVVRGFDT